MSTKNGEGRRRRPRARQRPELSRRPQAGADLDDLLREAEEALCDSDLPSGGWAAGGGAARPGLGRDPLPGAGPPSLRRAAAADGDLEAETALWLLFPPRGNA